MMCISTDHWPECSHKAIPSYAEAQEIKSLFQVAIGPAKTRDSTEEEQN